LSSPAAPALQIQQPVTTSSRRPALILLAIIFAAVYLGSVFSPPLLDDADSTHAEAAREMLATGDYLTLHRLAEARRLLATTDLPVSRVAEASGFGSVSRFYRAFTDACGIPPARFRRERRQ